MIMRAVQPKRQLINSTSTSTTLAILIIDVAESTANLKAAFIRMAVWVSLVAVGVV
jgi:hypothetical protein